MPSSSDTSLPPPSFRTTVASAAALLLLTIGIWFAVFHTGQRHDVLAAAFVLVVTALIAAHLRGRHTRWTPPTALDVLMLLFGGWLVMAALASPIPLVSGAEMLRLGLLFLGYALARALAPHAGLTTLLFLVVGATGSVFALLAVRAFFLGDPLPSGPFLNRNNFVAFLFLTSMFWGAALHCFEARLRPRPLVLAALAGAAAAPVFWVLGLVGSRGAILGALAGLIVLALLRPAYRRSPVLLGFLGGAVLGFLLASATTSGFMFARIATLGEPELAGASRFVIWQSLLPLIAESPWLGHGPGTLFMLWPPHRDPLDASAGFHAHNDVLAFAYAGGIPAALLFMGVLALALGTVFRQKETPAPSGSAWLIAGVIGVAVHALFTFNFSIAVILLLSGLALGLVAPAARGVTLQPIRSATRIGALVAAGLGLLLTAHAVTTAVGFRYHMSASEAERAGDYSAAFGAATQAIAWWPGADALRLHRGQILYRSVLAPDDAADNPMAPDAYRFVVADTEAALRLNPYRPWGYELNAQLALAGGRLGLVSEPELAAEQHLRAALARDPRTLSGRLLLAERLEARGDPEGALQVLMAARHFWYPRHTRKEYLDVTRALAQRLGDDQALERIPAD
ncbi:O-antigen ligase family protein [Ectothiorhodospiraceae bacterium 2226]|nr:O-antigen ligase family protein [Ectothiorhodospiraceae bacterium 2226]